MERLVKGEKVFMKIIFDSEEQKNAMMGLLEDDYCPNNIFLEDVGCNYGNSLRNDCENCWKNCGIEVEVKEEC